MPGALSERPVVSRYHVQRPTRASVADYRNPSVRRPGRYRPFHIRHRELDRGSSTDRRIRMERFDAVVIGGGMAGLPLALRAARHDRVALIERELLGGTCLNRGCIPTKTMIASANVAHSARNAAAFGVHTSAPTVDLAAVVDRKNGVVVDSIRRGSYRAVENDRSRAAHGATPTSSASSHRQRSSGTGQPARASTARRPARRRRLRHGHRRRNIPRSRSRRSRHPRRAHRHRPIRGDRRSTRAAVSTDRRPRRVRPQRTRSAASSNRRGPHRRVGTHRARPAHRRVNGAPHPPVA